MHILYKALVSLSFVSFLQVFSVDTTVTNIAFAAAKDLPAPEKIESKLKEIREWAKDAKIVALVKKTNAEPSPEAKSMNQEKWKSATVLDAFLKSLTKNDIGTFLKEHKGEIVTEAFVSAADGTKVGFLSKPTNWSHKGKPKHDVPMSGKEWQGPVELDDSTGIKQLQVAVPIFEGSTPIGALVVGLNIMKMQ
jgi:hypothetical protein